MVRHGITLVAQHIPGMEERDANAGMNVNQNSQVQQEATAIMPQELVEALVLVLIWLIHGSLEGSSFPLAM